ncbi:MAG: MFS transporter, partial [Clostridia bacterium]
VSLYVPLFVLGTCFGVLYPAMTTMLAQSAPPAIYGTAFSLYAAALSVGSIIGPMIAGMIGQANQSFFFSFLIAMLASLVSGWMVSFSTPTNKPVVR